MSAIAENLEPGAVLYDVVLGALKASGTSFEAWCRENSTNPEAARRALRGVNTGNTGRLLRLRLISGAGQEVVRVAYRERLRRNLAEIDQAEPINEKPAA